MRAIAAAVAALFLCLPAAASAQAIQPSAFASFQFRQHPGAHLPLDAALRDEGGRPVRLGAYFGRRPVILILEYLHCPNLCGLVLGGTVASLAQAHLQPGRDLEFVAISIDPRETSADAAAANASYRKRFGGAGGDPDGWHFLTGSEPEVRRIAASIGFPYRWDDRLRQYAHPAGFIVATPDGRISHYLPGLEPTPESLKSAVATAARDQVTPPVHPLLLLCLGYDPQPGSIAAAVIGALRILGVVVTLACLLLIVRLARRPARG
ncbi:MAG TPA: SCO family protein [Allosphingosinicella sp.]|nr:SCO family protein [Allosphingosinicella sp.]